MRNIYLIFTPFIILFGLSTSAFAQIEFCGTQSLDPQHEITLRDFQQNPEQYARIVNRRAPEYIPVTIHVVGDNNGNGYFTKLDVYREICELNAYYAPLEWVFFIEGDIRYINNSSYYNHSSSTVGVNMMVQNNVANTFNVYFVNDPAGTCGYYAPSGNAVAIRKSCAGSGSSTLAHEAGHFFSLPHTFSGWEGESYDGVNYVNNVEYVEQRPNSFTRYDCTRSGDGFCDTPPDYFSDRWRCGTDDTTIVDPDGAEFEVDGTYIMGYANDQCAEIFSEEQQQAMILNLTINRAALKRIGVPAPQNLSAASVIYPSQGSTVDISNGVRLEWSSVQNATSYHVLVTNYPAVSQIIQEFEVTTNFKLISGLEIGKNYSWRVKPLMETNTCAPYTNPTFFKTAALTAVKELELLEVYPNPSHYQVEISNIPDSCELIIRDLSGRVIESRNVQSNQIRVVTQDYSAGTYYFEFQKNGNSRVIPVLVVH